MECGDVSCDFVLATQRHIEWVLRNRTADMAVATMPHAPHHNVLQYAPLLTSLQPVMRSLATEIQPFILECVD